MRTALFCSEAALFERELAVIVSSEKFSFQRCSELNQRATEIFPCNAKRWNRTEISLNQSWSALNVYERSTRALSFCAMLYNMEAKLSAQMGHIRRFSQCLLIAFTLKRCAFTFLKYFSLICSKFAVECDWNSKNCQNIRNFVFIFWKTR